MLQEPTFSIYDIFDSSATVDQPFSATVDQPLSAMVDLFSAMVDVIIFEFDQFL